MVLVLREIEQLDYAAIASILAINMGTVRSRLHRARARFRELLTSFLVAACERPNLPPVFDQRPIQPFRRRVDFSPP